MHCFIVMKNNIKENISTNNKNVTITSLSDCITSSFHQSGVSAFSGLSDTFPERKYKYYKNTWKAKDVHANKLCDL